jgi:regulator of cell morphogenesis and NO signaling
MIAMPPIPATEVPRASRNLGTIAVELPGATAVFRRLKLDFCCGGQVPLDEACARKGLDTAAVLDELARLERGPDAAALPREAETPALIDHLLQRYHDVHRAQLPELIAMARRVEDVYRDHPAVPAGLADLLEQMHREMLDHMAKEEQILFPMIRAGGHPMIGHPIAVMRSEHLAHGAQLERLAELTADHTAPAGACTTWQALYAGTRQFQDDLMEHIHLENNLLFPRVEGGRAGPGR